MQPNVIQEAILSQSEDTNGSLHSFKRILDHRSGPYGRTEVQILWDTDEVTWEPVEIVRKDDPITVARYAKDKHLTEQRGWTWAKKIVERENKLLRMMKANAGQKKSGRKFKFGIEVPRTVKRALELDKKNRNSY